LSLAIYRLADRLHKSVEEIEALSMDELRGWFAYLRLEHKAQKR
jgi:hypothetical protein